MSEFICSQGMWHGPVCLFLRGSCSVCVYFHAGAGVCSHVGMAVVRWACWCQFTREDYQHHISSSGHEGLLHDPAPSYLFILFLVLAWHPLLPSASFLSLSLSPSAHLYRSSPPPAHHNINSPFASLSRPSRSLSVFASAPGGVRALLTMRSDWFLLAFHLSPSYALPSLRSLPRPSLLPPLSPSPLRLLIPTVLITPEGPSHERTFPSLCGFTI